MNDLIEEENKDNQTYTYPVWIVGLIVIFLTCAFALFGIVSASKVREADQASINSAKTKADEMVPVKNPQMEETIEGALLDSEMNAPPADLNLQDPFTKNLGGGPPAVGTTVPQGMKPALAPAPVTKLEPGKQTAANVLAPKNESAGLKMPQLATPPSLPSLESRYREWEQNLAIAQKENLPEPSVGAIYSVAEVIPTGCLESGDRKLVNFEVNHNQAEMNLQESFSLEKGERLYDAVISEVTDLGVYYDLSDGSRAFMGFVKEREIKTGAGNPAVAPSPVQTSGAPKSTSKNLLDSVEKTTYSDDFVSSLNVHQTHIATELINPEYQDTQDYANNTDSDYFHPVGFFHKTAFSENSSSTAAAVQNVAGPCSSSFVGENIRYTSGANLTLNEFLRDLQKLYQVSFIVDQSVQDEAVVLKVIDKPWNYVLEAILRSKGLEARCLTGDIISIEPKGKQAKVEQENQKTEPLILRRYTLRYIPLNSSSSTQIAGSVGGFSGGSGGGGFSGSGGGSGGGGNSGIEGQINQLLSRSGDNRASVSRIPNSNILAVYGTEMQQNEIAGFIKEIDRPGFQVILETNYYVVNDSAFRDIGGQVSVLIGNGAGTQIGGITNLPSAGGGAATGTTTGGLQPGNVSSLPSGFGAPSADLRASANTLFGGSFTVGTATFQALFSAAEQKGLANSQARSTQAVLDGGTTEIKNGNTIIIPTTGSVGGSLVNSGAITVNAVQSAAMQPQVVVDDNGNPVAVTLNLQLTNNSINRAFNTVSPVIATQSQSGTIRLPLNETYVVSGFFTDTVANTRNSTPGLSKIPGLGELFKRRTSQTDRSRLYFAVSVRVVRDIDLLKVPAPADIDTSPVAPPEPQKPSVPKTGKH